MCIVMESGRTHQKHHFYHHHPHSHLQRSREEHEELVLDYDQEEEEEGASNRHVRALQFRNPGRFMEDFDPERSTREMRKMNRRIYSESRKNQVYDESGLIMMDGRDICDCLEAKCLGCHYPCPKCHSTKCGGECRVNRRWMYTELELEGTNKKVYFPDPPQPYS